MDSVNVSDFHHPWSSALQEAQTCGVCHEKHHTCRTNQLKKQKTSIIFLLLAMALHILPPTPQAFILRVLVSSASLVQSHVPWKLRLVSNVLYVSGWLTYRQLILYVTKTRKSFSSYSLHPRSWQVLS